MLENPNRQNCTLRTFHGRQTHSSSAKVALSVLGDSREKRSTLTPQNSAKLQQGVALLHYSRLTCMYFCIGRLFHRRCTIPGCYKGDRWSGPLSSLLPSQQHAAVQGGDRVRTGKVESQSQSTGGRKEMKTQLSRCKSSLVGKIPVFHSCIVHSYSRGIFNFPPNTFVVFPKIQISMLNIPKKRIDTKSSCLCQLVVLVVLAGAAVQAAPGGGYGKPKCRTVYETSYTTRS